MRTPRLATSADMARAAELATTSGRIGVDTEFMSEGRYRPLLCLVQVAVAHGEAADIVLESARYALTSAPKNLSFAYATRAEKSSSMGTSTTSS